VRWFARGCPRFWGSVVCPRCRRQASAHFGGRQGAHGAGWLIPGYDVTANRIACPYCGYSAVRSPWPSPQLPFELWLKTNCRGRTLWAYNVSHVCGIERFLALGGTLDDEPAHPASLSNLLGLPEWMYRNRAAVRKGLARLLEMNLETTRRT
jgi:hypothetical protein